MTIDSAIEMLQRLKAQHGNVEVFFDCAHCGKSTQPDVVVAVAMLQKKPAK